MKEKKTANKRGTNEKIAHSNEIKNTKLFNF